MQLAIAQGGRTLDAFDTALPALYGVNGFRVVSRLPWDEGHNPKGWSKRKFKMYNNGEPDVVFMAYDPEGRKGRQSGIEGVQRAPALGDRELHP